MTEERWRPGDPVDWDHPGELWTGGGLHSFVLETIGARSGQLRRAVLGYLEEGTDGWLVIASKGGAPTNPAWVANLAAQPDAPSCWPMARASRSAPSGSRARSSSGPGSGSPRRRRSIRCIGRGRRARSRLFAWLDKRDESAAPGTTSQWVGRVASSLPIRNPKLSANISLVI